MPRVEDGSFTFAWYSSQVSGTGTMLRPTSMREATISEYTFCGVSIQGRETSAG